MFHILLVQCDNQFITPTTIYTSSAFWEIVSPDMILHNLLMMAGTLQCQPVDSARMQRKIEVGFIETKKKTTHWHKLSNVNKHVSCSILRHYQWFTGSPLEEASPHFWQLWSSIRLSRITSHYTGMPVNFMTPEDVWQQHISDATASVMHGDCRNPTILVGLYQLYR